MKTLSMAGSASVWDFNLREVIMSWLSQAKNFVFNGIFAQAARAAGSTDPTTKAVGEAATQALSTVAVDITTSLQQHNSPIAIKNVVVKDVEDGIKEVLDAAVEAAMGSLPVVGGLLAPEAVSIANLGLDFMEQHALTYVSALFANHRTAVNATPTNAAPLVSNNS
jgi:hypothetical protein